MAAVGNADFTTCYRQSFSPIIDGNNYSGPRSEINPNAMYVATDGIDNVSRAGTIDEPFATRQFAIDNKPAGLDYHVYLMAGTYNDYSAGPITGYQGTEISVSGTEQSPVVFEPYPGATVILDMLDSAAAFNIIRASWVFIRGFEIRNTYGSAVYTGREGSGNFCTDILVDDNWIHDCDGIAGDNVGAIRFDDCIRGTARNNKLHTIRVGGVPNGNAAGVHGYNMEDMLIEQNTIYDVFNGVFHKLSTGNEGLLIRRNLIHTCDQGIYYDVQGAGSPAHANQRVTQNIFYGNGSDIYLNAFDAVGNNDVFDVWNNTFDEVSLGVSYEDNTINIEFFNNIYSPGVIDRALMVESETINTLFSDYQLFDTGSDRFQVDRFEGGQINYDTLAAWQAGESKDSNSTVANPLFVNKAARDYRLQAGSPALSGGRGGAYSTVRGAYITGTEQIGCDF